MNFAWPVHSSWQQPSQRLDRIPAPTQRTRVLDPIEIRKQLEGLEGRVTAFPQNPSFIAALNRSKSVSLPSVSRQIPPTNPAVYGMQRNMFERVKVTGNGCGSCRGNK